MIQVFEKGEIIKISIMGEGRRVIVGIAYPNEKS